MEKYNDILGKIPPQAVDLECSVLGGILSAPELIMEIESILKPECFYKPAHREIYSSILDIYYSNKEPDIMNVSQHLHDKNKSEEVGGAVYLSELTDMFTFGFKIIEHARVVYQKYLHRELIAISSEISTLAFDESQDIAEVLEIAQKKIFNVDTVSFNKEPEHIRDLVKETLITVEQAEKDEKPIGIHTSWKDISFYNSHLTIIGARPGMGKTFVGAVKFAFDIAMYDIPVLIFSLEMTKQELSQRFISLASETNSENLRDVKNVQWDKIEPCVPVFENLPVFIDDTPALSIWQIMSKSRKMKLKYGIGCIIVDYLQLATAKEKGANRENEISTISRGLKTIAKELNVPVIALSQLNRLVESRGNKRPQLSDLRESGAIEQDADRVLFLHREYYYSNDLADAGVGEIYDGKNRHGKLVKCNYYHSLDWSKISEDNFEQNIFSETTDVNF